jgi:ribonuclease-3
MEGSARLGAGLDWKTSLQELAAARSLGVPEYRVEESGPDHEKLFTASAVLGEAVHGTGTGRSKKEAEQRAAEEAYTALSAVAADFAAAADAAPTDTAPTDTAPAPDEPTAEPAEATVEASDAAR